MIQFPFSKFIYRFTLLALLFSFLFLESCKGPKAATAETDTLPDALLWKIEHKDLPNPSYLFGTIHMIPQEDFFLPAGLEEAFLKSDKVVFEIDMDDMSDMGSLMGMMSGLMMKDGMTLQKLLTPAEYKEVSEYFEAMGMPMFLLGNVKPMFLSMLAEVNLDPTAMQSEEIVSYEMALYDKANETSKQVGGLETMAYQMSLFDSIPYKDQAIMLLDAVRGTNLESDMFEETVELYKMQKIEAMVAMVGEASESADGNYEDVLLNNRNRNWIPVMEKKMKKGSTFFAVGAGHLGGDQGVIRLLRKEGYTVTPVSVYRQSAPKKI
ncbi:MAG: TraB/GumN family protein [Saprospiraceae bacterium]|nr:TraB/GumN family protein [Saprospiraceae bacterium]